MAILILFLLISVEGMTDVSDSSTLVEGADGIDDTCAEEGSVQIRKERTCDKMVYAIDSIIDDSLRGE